MKNIHALSLVVLSLAGAAGCTTAVAPPELLTARSVYDRAAHGPTAQVDPTDLHTARLALCQATRQVIGNGLAILGVSAPERM